MLAAAALLALPARGQNNEIGLTLGAFLPGDKTSGGNRAELGSGPAFQFNYGRRVAGGATAAIYLEVHVLANPLRDISSNVRTASRDVATLYALPGVRVKFASRSRFAPYVAAGGGYALYEQSRNSLDGAVNTAPRFRHRGAFGYGGGIDVFPIWKFFGARMEVRNFYTGLPAYNVNGLAGGQNNVAAGGGFVLQF
jgi:opacity protein-like surface antigen